MNILLIGDSFAADWTVKYPEKLGWPNLLAKKYTVLNLARAGCSEYQIYQQLQLSALDKFDLVIVSHTSPYRIYTEYHPARRNDILHQYCDLLYSDIKELAITNSDYNAVKIYFEKFFDLTYAKFMHQLIIKEIVLLLKNKNVLHITHNFTNDNMLSLSKIYNRNQGFVNHYSEIGNNLVFDLIDKNITRITSTQ